MINWSNIPTGEDGQPIAEPIPNNPLLDYILHVPGVAGGIRYGRRYLTTFAMQPEYDVGFKYDYYRLEWDDPDQIDLFMEHDKSYLGHDTMLDKMVREAAQLLQADRVVRIHWTNGKWSEDV